MRPDDFYFDEICHILSFLSFYNLYTMKMISHNYFAIISAYLKSNNIKQNILSPCFEGIYSGNVHLFLRDTMTSFLPDILPFSKKIQEKTVYILKNKLGEKCKSLTLSLEILTPAAYVSMIKNMNIDTVHLMLPNTLQIKKLMKRKISSDATRITIDTYTKNKQDITLLKVLNWISFRNLISLNFRGNVGSIIVSKHTFPNLKHVHLLHTGQRTHTLDTIASFAMLGLELLAVQHYFLVTSTYDTTYMCITDIVRVFKPKILLLDPLPLTALKEVRNYGGSIMQGTTFIEEEYEEAVSILE